MPFPDMRTLCFLRLSINFLFSLLMVVLWLQNRGRFGGTHLWAAGFWLYTAGIALLILRDIVPDMMSIILGNVLIIAGAFMILAGLERFTGRRGTHFHTIAIVAVFFAVQIFFTYVHPDLSARVINFSVAFLFPCLHGLWLVLYRLSPQQKATLRGVGIAFAGYAAVNLIRILNVIVSPDDPTALFSSSGLDAFFLAAFILLAVLLTYSLSLSINKTLLGAVVAQEEKFSKAFYSSPNALTLSRLSDGKILETNDNFSRFFGYSSAEIKGKTSLELNIWYDDRDRQALVDDLIQYGRIQERELLLKHKSGQVLCGLVWSDRLFLGNEPCILSSVLDITDRKQQQFEREALIEQLQEALSDVKTLSGLLPICSSCKKIRDDKGYWNSLEAYIHKHSLARFSHGICPECTKKLYPDLSKNNT